MPKSIVRPLPSKQSAKHILTLLDDLGPLPADLIGRHLSQYRRRTVDASLLDLVEQGWLRRRAEDGCYVRRSR